ncbi:MAG TPA: His-Xaa-Ser system radical SAM maturase HxsB [Gammaproteobacteria bacterium]|nr:His-Xaa-Ser system radical SAM maturase HxsB [Gammaproteobacteria bacterium]
MAAELAKRFHSIEYFSHSRGRYKFLPFNFSRRENSVLLTNLVGEYTILPEDKFDQFINKSLAIYEASYNELKSKHFLLDEDSSAALDLLALKYRTKQSRRPDFTGLHMFVVTLRCDYSCPYCQVSRQSTDKRQYDMSEETARKSLELVFKSPSHAIKIEFQGGEPLLNFELIKYIITTAEELNKYFRKDLQFVIATNLSFLTDKILDFVEEYGVYLSTSLDGHQALHDKNRPRPGRDGYKLTTANIAKARKRLGPDKIGALMTTTEASLNSPVRIIDEYLNQGFDSIFLRPLSPYGFAVKTRLVEQYNVTKWVDFYKESLAYIFTLNKNGVFFREEYTTLVLEKILSPFNPGYVDLQSPSGIAISAVVYNYDGDVYASDESRMLAEMGDDSLRIGNVHKDKYADIFANEKLLEIIETSVVESVPMCSDCVYQQYCGADPIYHLATQQDTVGHKALSGFCQKNMAIFDYVISILESDSEESSILRSWSRLC